MKKLFFLIILIIISTSCLAQKKMNTIDSIYVDYFRLTREIPYLHLNKTTFIPGEEIWFQAYVYDLNSKKLHKNTTNLYCNIYNKDGSLKEQKLFLVTDGIASGNIKIDSSYTKESYFIRASTNYMKNFNEDHSFIQKVTIVKKNNDTIREKLSSKYDLQLLPESGHLISNNVNSLGILIKDKNGKGIKIDNGEIVDSKGRKITNFTTNKFGLGKTSVFLKDDGYVANINLEDGIKISQKLPNILANGVIMSVINPQTNIVQISIKTNKKSLKYLKEKNYTLLVHNTSNYFKRTLVFNNKDTDYDIYFNKKKFNDGVNIVTLFNHKNIPIAERIFFNYKPKLISHLQLSTIKKESDSIKILITKKDSSVHYLSTSVLPKQTKSLSSNRKNIFSQLLLEPYINGIIETPSYYFKNINRKVLNDLDLLLLNQGWSKYKWSNIFNNRPKERFNFEKGINLSGQLYYKPNKEKVTVALFSPDNNLALTSEINNNFEFKNLYLKDTSLINLSVFNGLKQKKTRGYVRSSIHKEGSKRKITIDRNYLNHTQLNKYKKTTTLNLIDKFIDEKSNVLEEVIINAKKFKNKPKPSFGFISKSIKINRPYKGIFNIVSFLLSEGFYVDRKYGTIIEIRRRNNRITNPFSGRSTEIGAGMGSKIFLEDSPIYDLSILNTFYVDDFSEIFISKHLDGEIYFYLNYEGRFNKVKNKFKRYKIPLGFSVEKEYYQPKYASFNSSFFDDFGSIYWKSKIKLNKKDKIYTFKIPNLGKEAVKIIIEGITNNGSLISIEKNLSLD